MVGINERELLDLIVTVKAYPAVGIKTGEAVCVAGVEYSAHPKWIRLFPVPFRDLPQDVQFRKWQRVQVEATRPRSDPRPESWTPDIGTLRMMETLPAGDWKQRRELIDQLPERTMCEMNALNKMEPGRDTKADSLAVVRPRAAPKLSITRRTDDDISAGRAKQAQGALPIFASATEPIEVLEYSFHYQYQCLNEGCNGHRQSIIDWEIAQAYRRWRDDYPDSWQEQLRKKWEDQLWAQGRDTRLFVGNQHQHPASFLILGVFWPPDTPLQGQLRLE